MRAVTPIRSDPEIRRSSIAREIRTDLDGALGLARLVCAWDVYADEHFKALSVVFGRSDRERAVELIQKGRHAAHRCEALIARIARSNYDAGTVTALVLATRHYKRIGGHVLNILSSIVMPIHKIDYYDEDEVPEATDQRGRGVREQGSEV